MHEEIREAFELDEQEGCGKLKAAFHNSLHWVLDMTFREDASRVRRGDAAENLSMLRRLVLNICRRNKTGKSNPSKVRRAGWNDDVRTQLLLGAGTPDPPG